MTPASPIDPADQQPPADDSAAQQAAADAATQPPAGTVRKNAFAQVSPTMWAFLAVLVLMAGLVGYIVGDKNSTDTTASGASGSSAGTAATSGGSNQGGQDDSGQAIRDAQAAKDAEPGKGAIDQIERTDGQYDAMIMGPGGPLNTQEDVLNVHRRNPADPFAIGAVDAPVVITEFSDFECPFCSRYYNQTEPTIMDDYVKKGLVRIEWNDMPINGPHAEAGARAGRAAAAQGKFNEFKHELYTASSNVNGHPGFEMEDFKKFAKAAGVPDLDKFEKDASGDQYSDVVLQARAYASQLGVSGTPAFVVGDQFISGAQPTDVFVQVINQQLAKVADGTNQVPQAAKDAAKSK